MDLFQVEKIDYLQFSGEKPPPLSQPTTLNVFKDIPLKDVCGSHASIRSNQIANEHERLSIGFAMKKKFGGQMTDNESVGPVSGVAHSNLS